MEDMVLFFNYYFEFVEGVEDDDEDDEEEEEEDEDEVSILGSL